MPETTAPNWNALLRQAEDRLSRRMERRQDSSARAESAAVLELRLQQAIEDLDALRQEYNTLAESYEAVSQEREALATDLNTLAESYDQQLVGSAIDRRAWELGLNPDQADVLARLVEADPDALFTEEGDLSDDALDAVVFAAIERHGDRIGVDKSLFESPEDSLEGAGAATAVKGTAAPAATTKPTPTGTDQARQSAGVGGRTGTGNPPQQFLVTRQQAASAIWKQENREALTEAVKAGTFAIAE